MNRTALIVASGIILMLLILGYNKKYIDILPKKEVEVTNPKIDSLLELNQEYELTFQRMQGTIDEKSNTIKRLRTSIRLLTQKDINNELSNNEIKVKLDTSDASIQQFWDDQFRYIEDK